MPLGLFGGSSKGHVLPSDDGGRHKSDKKESTDNARGTVLRLEKHVVTVEKKLAEGGFAIVYLVSDQKNRQFALKRQFVNDDPQQVDTCKRECLVLSSLRGHKNIASYVDHLIARNKNGVYDCMLLTAYYKTSVLHQMNSRLSEGRHFSPSEVLAIFCDMCEAVARLHHATTPLMHRDLKVENILVDERNRAAPPVYVLCDFGSATTRVLSTATHSHSLVQQEIERYTTLSYRAPEMVDLYSQTAIGTPADIWAMGVMLYKLCFFALPFGESAMAIQNGALSFPSHPPSTPPLRALIKCLLRADLSYRPNIFQTSSLSFEAAGRSCPVSNLHKVPLLRLESAVAALDGATPTPLQREEGSGGPSMVTTADESPLPTPSSTSVHPRLRPKPLTSLPRLPLLSASSSPQMSRSAMEVPSSLQPSSGAELSWEPLQPRSAPPPQEEVKETRNEEEKETTKGKETGRHVRNLSDGGTLSKSAFRPYSEMWSGAGVEEGAWNAFQDAPLAPRPPSTSPTGDTVDWSDPFRSAPFDPRPILVEREKERLKQLQKEEEKELKTEGESDMEEQRMMARSFSYEHIDGVGEEGSSDSRGRTDGETTEDGTPCEEDHGESTDGATDGGGEDAAGSRPLLDDDELDDEYEEVTSSWCVAQEGGVPSPLPSPIPSPPFALPRMATNPFNPFLVGPDDPRLLPSVDPPPSSIISLNDDMVQRCPVDPSLSFLSSRAPATLPRQATSLVARPPQPSTPSREEAESPLPVTFSLPSENRKSCHSSQQYSKMGSGTDSDSTDDSGAGICAPNQRRKKRRDTDGGPVPRVPKPVKRHSASAGKSSQAALNASFVNVSFQSEDVDRF